MSELGKRVEKRLHARVIVTTSGADYIFTIEKNRKRSVLTLRTGPKCSLPITAAMAVTCSDSASAVLGTVDQLLNWIVEAVK
jgi:hypothetical protein